MATQDIRLERIDKEYGSLRLAQNRLLDKVDGYEEALAKLTEVVVENRNLIMENREMLLAIVKHLEVPYEEKLPMGFSKE